MSKWRMYDEIIKKTLLSNEELSDDKISRIVLQVPKRNEESDLLRTYIRRNRSRLLDINEGIYEACEQINVDFTSAKNLWIKTNNKDGLNISGLVVNPNYVAPIVEEKLEKEIDFLSIFKDKITPVKINNDASSFATNKCIFDRGVITDVHVGMDVNKDGYSLYDGSWAEKEIFESLDVFVNEIFSNQKSDTLLLHELGDFLDGWDGYTTRGGHKLPQNMDSQKAFDIGLKFKITLIDALFTRYNTIEVVNICNDNHAGAFGYVVNSAFKTYIELKYPDNITVTNQRKFIDHYIKGNKCFILTHGKDDKSLKFGFKPKLEPVQIEKIKNYIDEYKLWQYNIEFSKGDSHQLLIDWTSSTAFEYQNFGAISPPSDWVKTNFKNTSRSFVTFNYYENKKSLHPFIF